jgi:palmitoyltransferase
VSRYDHHCPWINNCVSSYNLGKFTLFLLLLILGCVEVMFLSISFYLDTFERIRPTTLFPLGEDKDKYALINMLLCGGLAAVFCVMLFSLLGDQLKNLFSNTPSYERAKNVRRKGSSLLTAHSEEGMMDAINSETKPEVTLDEEDADN